MDQSLDAIQAFVDMTVTDWVQQDV